MPSWGENLAVVFISNRVISRYYTKGVLGLLAKDKYLLADGALLEVAKYSKRASNLDAQAHFADTDYDAIVFAALSEQGSPAKLRVECAMLLSPSEMVRFTPAASSSLSVC